MSRLYPDQRKHPAYAQNHRSIMYRLCPERFPGTINVIHKCPIYAQTNPNIPSMPRFKYPAYTQTPPNIPPTPRTQTSRLCPDSAKHPVCAQIQRTRLCPDLIRARRNVLSTPRTPPALGQGRWLACPSVCPCVRLSVGLSARRPSVYRPVVRLFVVRLSIGPSSVCLSVCLSVCPATRRPVGPPVRRPACPPTRQDAMPCAAPRGAAQRISGRT